MALDETQRGDHERELDEAVAAYARAAHAGQAPDPQEWLARHPGLAPELAEFLADRAHLERVAAPLYAGLPPAVAGGRTFAGYEILEEVGRGGMGVVYKARQTSLNRPVALKMILAGQLASPADVQRFRQEAENAGHLDHPNIVPIYEVGECDGQHFFSMKLIEGPSLVEKISHKGAKGAKADEGPSSLHSLRLCAKLLTTVARAVQYAHQRGILHRDLKPANILLDAQGQPHVTDFGLAKRVEGDSALTQSGAVVGTPSYMAPEQAAGEKRLTTAADVYSLGAVLYELLTGRPPFRAEKPLDTLLQLRTQEPPRPRALNPRLDRDLETICLKCLEKDPQRRYGSAEALADDLERWLHGEPIRARPVGRAERVWRWCRRNPALAAAVGVVTAALVAVTALATAFAAHQAEVAEKVRKEKQQAEAALRESKRLSALMALDHGLRLCEEDVARGMLWLARGLEVAPADDAGLQRALRTNLAAWGRQLHALRGYAEYGHADYLLFSADGRLAVTAGRDRANRKAEVRLWEADTGKPLGPAWEHGKPLESLALSPDGRAVLLGSNDGTARLWDARTGKPLGPPLQHDKHSINCLAVTPEGKALLAGMFAAEFRLWDAVAGKPLGARLRHGDEVRAGAFSRDGKRFLTLSDWRSVLWWDTGTGKVLGGAPWPGVEVQVAAFSPDGKTVLTGGRGEARFWKVGTREPLGVSLRYQGIAEALAFSGDGKRALTASRREHLDQFEIRHWIVEMGKPLGPPLRQEGPLVAVTFRPDGRTFLTATAAPFARGWAVRLWEPAPGLALGATDADDPLAEFHVPLSPIPAAFRPDGKVFATPLFQNAARLWDAATGKPLGPRLTHAAPVTALAFSPDGNTLLTWDAERTVCRWDAATGKHLGHQTFVSEGPEGAWATFSPNGRTVLVRSLQSARLWDVATGKPVGQPLQPVGEIRNWFDEAGVGAFSPDARLVLTAGPDASARLWDAATGKPVGAALKPAGAVHAAAFRPDGKVVVTGGDDETGQRGEAQLWEAVTGQPVRPPLAHRRPVTAVAFSPDGKTVLTGSRDGTARLWDAATGKPIHPPRAHRGRVLVAAFSPDGKTALTATRDQTLQLWDVATGKPLGPALPCDSKQAEGVITAAFRPDGRAILAGTWDRAFLWAVPAPLAGEPERLRRWVEVSTGLELDASGAVVELDAAAWGQRRERPRQLGGPPEG
jgi:eukaryotic-like serine/threonine-protein kinase